MATSVVQIDSRQRQRLARRAKKSGKSLNQEVHEALELYLSVPPAMQRKLSATAKAANRAADRMIKRIDQTIAYVERSLKKIDRTPR
jgi:hypothetical protein